MYLLGLDLGSSSIKAALIDEGGNKVGLVQYPDTELEIAAPKQGWAEQHPEDWWINTQKAINRLLETTDVKGEEIAAIGIGYQMHGLVQVDENQNVLRPSIIWCDSRAVSIGNTAYEGIGKSLCLSTLLNPPGNFTASKLKWVKDNQPEIYDTTAKIMLPGDFIAMKMTGRITTTVSGLSEGMFWDFRENKISEEITNYFEFEKDLYPDVIGSFESGGGLTSESAEYLGLKVGTPVTYRAGDQPNNALSLGALHPGDVAATGGTSGVVYGVVDKPVFDELGRINAFANVNHSNENPRIGLLLCINGAGIQYSWLRKLLGDESVSYNDLERIAATVPIGSEGVIALPFGNGAERMLENAETGAHYLNVHFNRHGKEHFYRAVLEGVAFAFVYGVEVLKELGMSLSTIRVGNDNLFQSTIFSKAIANTLNSTIEIYDTTGAYGAAKAAGVAIGVYESPESAFKKEEPESTITPDSNQEENKKAYQAWKQQFLKTIH